MNPQNFFAELKRRNVYKVAVAYLLAGWALAQGLAQVLPVFDVPNWIVRVLIVLVILGFPVALSLAWVYEITAEGIKRTEDVEPGRSIRHRTGRKIVALTIGFAALALAVTVFRLPRARETTTASSPATNQALIPAKSIAVLPFDSLSEDKSNAYFADGIQEEILTKLASIADLKVISRTSTAKYKSKPEDLKVVSQQLAVATVLEGSVQRAGDKVRINVQLIDARADSHLWAKSYDGDAKDIFAVESEVSQQIADALRAKLSPSETKTLAKAPTENPDAYDLFLKGEYQRRQGESLLTAEWFERAGAYYEQALSLDPKFALAAARLAQSRLWLHFYARPLSTDELAHVRAIIDRALALDPELAESHEALGLFHYWGHLDYEPALVELRRAVELQPNNARARAFAGWVYRRQGRWKESLAEVAKAEALDPRDPNLPASTAFTYTALRQWAEAKRAGSRAVALDPHNVAGLRPLVIAALNGDGDIAAARRVVAALPLEERAVGNLRGGVIAVINYRPYLSVMERDFDAALRDVPNLRRTEFDRSTTLAARAAIQALARRSPDPDVEEARGLLEARLRERPDDGFAITQLSWVYVALGRNADALRLAGQAAEARPIEKDALSGTAFAVGLAEIQAWTGETAEAVKGLRRLLAIPAGNEVSLKRLQLDPLWDPIRNDPEFQQLLAGRELIGPNK